MEPLIKKELYEAPETMIEVITLEGVIAASAPDFGDGGEIH